MINLWVTVKPGESVTDDCIFAGPGGFAIRPATAKDAFQFIDTEFNKTVQSREIKFHIIGERDVIEPENDLLETYGKLKPNIAAMVANSVSNIKLLKDGDDE